MSIDKVYVVQTTDKNLSERFGILQSVEPKPYLHPVFKRKINNLVAQIDLLRLKNKRLIQQIGYNTDLRNRPVKQRLNSFQGQNFQLRRSGSDGNIFNGQGGMQRIGSFNSLNKFNSRGRSRLNSTGSISNFSRASTPGNMSQMSRGNRGNWRRGQGQNRYRTNQINRLNGVIGRNKQSMKRGGMRGRGGGRGRGRGRGGQMRNQPRPTVSKEELDQQLEHYMAGTRAELDHQIETYMSSADQEMTTE